MNHKAYRAYRSAVAAELAERLRLQPDVAEQVARRSQIPLRGFETNAPAPAVADCFVSSLASSEATRRAKHYAETAVIHATARAAWRSLA